MMVNNTEKLVRRMTFDGVLDSFLSNKTRREEAFEQMYEIYGKEIEVALRKTTNKGL